MKLFILVTAFLCVFKASYLPYVNKFTFLDPVKPRTHFRFLSAFPNLKSFTWHSEWPEVSDAMWEDLCTLTPNLLVLEIGYPGRGVKMPTFTLSDNALSCIARLTHLKQLNICLNNPTPETKASIEKKIHSVAPNVKVKITTNPIPFGGIGP